METEMETEMEIMMMMESWKIVRILRHCLSLQMKLRGCYGSTSRTRSW